jgi:outer membrane receptor for ferrienterochelin and colicin
MKNIFQFLLLITFLFNLQAFSQTGHSVIQGKITDEKGDPLPFANVILKETNNGSATDRNGFYRIMARPGTFTIEISYIGYEKVTEKINLILNRTVEANYTLKSISFEIGGIEVTADNEFIPIEPTTKTKVTSGEIEHIQASSLNDVMELTPGVKTSNPTLNTVEKAVIRGGDALGTQIIMDGVPVSNNANLQVGIGYSTANSGVDLRSIPAENIKEVEIIRGVPSAQYGDLVDGLLLVKTKAEPHQPRIKFKYNPNLYESNMSSGIRLSSWVFNGNLNIASSDRDFRIEGDGYTRIAGQLSAELQNDDYEIKNIFYVTRAFDEKKEVPGYALREAWYNRDLQLKYTGNYNYSLNQFSQISSRFSVSFTNQDSYNQAIVSRDNIVISDRIEEGSQEGRIVFGSYLGKKWIKGRMWNLYADLNYQFRFFTGDYLHSWIAGAEWKNDFNKGAGIVFDPLYPPSLSIPSPRIRTYEQIPSYNILSLYAEDKLTGNFIRPFTLQAGLRYEVYRPDGLNIGGVLGKKDLISSSNGSFLNPRLNFSFNLFEKTQIRLSYGVATKSAPLGMIFAQDKYYDYVDTNSVVNPQYADSNFAIISTYIRNQANPEIKAYVQKKYEASIDQQIANVGFTFTFFSNSSNDEFTSFSEPTVFYKKRFPEWPDQSNAVPYDTLIETYTRYANNGWRNIRGMEFGFRTRKIPVINTILKVDAAYTYGEYGTTSGYNYSTKRFFNALGITVIPMYNKWNNYYKDLLINYRFEIQAQALGMWLTLHLQQQLFEIDGRVGYGDTLAVGYYTNKGETIILSEAERTDPMYSQLKRNVEVYELNEENRPNKFLLNLKVTKALWDGAAISFYVNNFLNNRPVYSSLRRNPNFPQYERRNIEIFYGIEFHSSLTGIMR